jgi:hypothetical protein
MFIHFDSSEAENCDDCGNPTSLAHVCAKQSPRGLNLCAACFRRFTLAIVQACKKLGAASSPEKLVPGRPSMVPA